MITNFKIFENNTVNGACSPYYNIHQFDLFIRWFCENYKDKMEEEGWLVSYANLTIPIEYNITYSNRTGYFWQVQKNDETGILGDDMEAEKLAKDSGLMVDEYGIVIGYDGVSFLEHPEELEFYRDITKYNI